MCRRAQQGRAECLQMEDVDWPRGGGFKRPLPKTGIGPTLDAALAIRYLAIPDFNACSPPSSVSHSAVSQGVLWSRLGCCMSSASFSVVTVPDVFLKRS